MRIPSSSSSSVGRRDQTATDQDEVSRRSGVSCDPGEDRCRHEFGPDTHLPTLLARFPRLDPLRPERYGVQDFSGDLTTKFQLQRQAEALYASMPENLRQEYPTWRMFWRALETGQLELVDKAPAPTEVPSGGDGASPSDSAAAPATK